MDRRQSPSRAGFTLIEVLIAVSIVALLVALLLPAIRAAYITAQRAQVSAELNNMATALTNFKTTYGDLPPSRVVLCEAGYNHSGLSIAQLAAPAGPLSPSGNDTDLSVGQLIQRSRLYLRRFWPRVDFDNGTIPFDFNNNGVLGENLTLSGSECLTFFLGGQPTSTNNQGNFTYSMSGFSKLPTNPFLGLLNNVSNPTASNRTVPYYEFNNGRLVDLDGDGIPSYIDPLDTTPGNQRAYAYFSSYGTNSYDPNDDNGNGKLNAFEEEDNTATYVERGFTVGFPNSTQATTAGTVVSPAPNPYCTGNPVTTAGMSWINPNSFQLFSCGTDRYWGLGGQYVQNSLTTAGVAYDSSNNPYVTGKLPIGVLDPGIVNTPGDFTNGIRNRESDNLTNFSGGRLD